MQLSALQIVLLVLVAAEINVDRRGLSLTHARPVIVGFLCGLILGDMNSGLYIGGTFTLMSLVLPLLAVLLYLITALQPLLHAHLQKQPDRDRKLV